MPDQQSTTRADPQNKLLVQLLLTLLSALSAWPGTHERFSKEGVALTQERCVCLKLWTCL